MFFRKRKRKCPTSWTNNKKSNCKLNSLLLLLLFICSFQVVLSQVLEFKSNNFSDFKLKNKAPHWTGRSARQFLANNPKQQKVSTSTTRLFAVAGQSVELQCPLANELLASSNRSIVWRKEKNLLNNQLSARQRINALNGSLVILNAQVELDEGEFECNLIDQQDLADSKSIKAHKFELKLLVKPKLAPFEFASNAQVGMKVVLTCAALEGQQPMSFVWLKDNQLISNDGKVANSLSQLHQQQLADKFALMESRRADNEYALIGQDEPEQDEDVLLALLSDSNVRTRQADDYSILSIEKLELKHAGTYTCSVQNEAARATHSSQLVINAPPTLIVEPQSGDLVSGQSRLFECAASGQPKPAISWFRARESEGSKMFDYVPLYDNLRYTTLSNGSLAIANITKREQGFYLCSAKNGFGPETTKLIRVTVHEPPKFNPKFKTMEVHIEERANMLCSASGEPPLTIDWLDKEGKAIQESDKKFIIENEPKIDVISETIATNKEVDAPLANLTLSRLILTRSGRLDSGHYTCIASNKHGKDKMVTNLLVQDVPDKVSELKVTNVTSSTISLRWQVGFSGNSPISSYLIQYQSDDPLDELLMASNPIQERPAVSPASLDALTNIASTLESAEEAIDRTLVELTVEQSASNLIVKDLSPYCVYRLRLAAINKIGLSEFTDWIRVKTEEAAPGGVSLKISAAATGPNSIKLTWLPPDRRNWNGQLTGFNILYRPIDSTFELNKTLEWAAPSMQSIMVDVDRQRQLAAANKTNIREHLRRMLALQQQELVAHLTNLQRSTTYLLWIQAINNKGFGPQSAPISVRTLEDVPPSAPLLKVQSNSESSITIAWSMLTNFVSPANQYSLFYRKLPTSSNLTSEATSDYLMTHQLQEVGPFVERTISSQQLLAIMSTNQANFDNDKPFVHNQQQHHHQQLVYTLDQLDCGSAYELYMITRNSVGKSEPSTLISTRTVGDPPIAPPNKQTLFAKIAPNEANLNLAVWSSGGCPLTHITFRYKPSPMGTNSSISWPISTNVPSSLLINLNKQLTSGEHLIERDWPNQTLFALKNLSPSTNYELQMIAYNSAGHTLAQFDFSTANPNGSRPNLGRREGSGVFRAVDVFGASGSVEQQAAFANQSGTSGQLIPLVLMLLCFVCLIISSSFCYYRIRDSWKDQQSRPSRNCDTRRSPTASTSNQVKSGSVWRGLNQHQLHSALKQSQELADYCDPNTNQLAKHPKELNQSLSMRDFNLITNPRATSSTLNLKHNQQRKSSYQSELPKTSTLQRATMLTDSYANYATNQLCSSAFCMEQKQPEICANLASINQYSENQCATNYDNEQQETSWTTNYGQFGESTKATYAVPAQTYGQLYQTSKQVNEYQAENGYGEIDQCIQRLVEQQYQHCHQQQQQYAMIVNMKPDQQQQNRCIYGPNESFANGQLQVNQSSDLQSKTSGQQSVIDSSSSSSGIDLGAHIDCASSATGTSNSNGSQDAYPQQQNCDLNDFRSASKAHFQQSHLQCVNEIDLKQS